MTNDNPDVPREPRTWQEIKAEREQETQRLRRRTEARRIKRIVDAISWHGGCLVPGCDEKVFSHAGFLKDPERMLPFCVHHELIVWAQVQRVKREPTYVEAINERHALEQIRFEQEHEDEKRAHLAKQDGHIYFLRLNGLIKVGWSRNLPERLKHYGPDVELLCHYPATRPDETLMHRQLRPYLAKGREWYQDCKLIEDIVADLVKQHGPPRMSAYWTEPKPKVIKPRRWSA